MVVSIDDVVGGIVVGTLAAAAFRSDSMPELWKILPVVGMGYRVLTKSTGSRDPRNDTVHEICSFVFLLRCVSHFRMIIDSGTAV